MISESLVLCKRALTKWVRNPGALIIGLIQGIFWLALFGNSFNPANDLPSSTAAAGSLGPLQQAFAGAPNYVTFLTPGVIALVAISSITFLGADMILDKVNGYLGMVSTYPIPRSSIFFGGALQSIVKSLLVAVITFALAFVVPNGLRLAQGFSILDFLGFLLILVLLMTIFATLFTGISISLKSTDSFYGLVNFILFPILFTSTALFPISFFPTWMKPVARVNPVSLANEAARLLIVNGSLSTAQFANFSVDLVGLLVYVVFFVVLGTLMARNALKPR